MNPRNVQHTGLSQKIIVQKYSGILQDIKQKSQKFSPFNLKNNYSPILISKQKIKFLEEEDVVNEFQNQVKNDDTFCVDQSISQMKSCDEIINQNSYIDDKLSIIFKQARTNKESGSQLTSINLDSQMIESNQIVCASNKNNRLYSSRSQHLQSQNQEELNSNLLGYSFYKHSMSRSRSNQGRYLSQSNTLNEKESLKIKNQKDPNNYKSIIKYKQSNEELNLICSVQQGKALRNKKQIKQEIQKENQENLNEFQYIYENSKYFQQSRGEQTQISQQISNFQTLNDTCEIIDNAKLREYPFASSQIYPHKNIAFNASILQSTIKRNDHDKENDCTLYSNKQVFHKQDQFGEPQTNSKMLQSMQIKQKQKVRMSESIVEFDTMMVQDINPTYQSYKNIQVQQIQDQYYKSRQCKRLPKQCIEVEIILPTEKSRKKAISQHDKLQQGKEFMVLQGKDMNDSFELQEVKKKLFMESNEKMSDFKFKEQQLLKQEKLKKRNLKITNSFFFKWKTRTYQTVKVIQKLTGVLQLSIKIREFFEKKLKSYFLVLSQISKSEGLSTQFNVNEERKKILMNRILNKREETRLFTQLIKYFERWRMQVQAKEKCQVKQDEEQIGHYKIYNFSINESHSSNQSASTHNQTIEKYTAKNIATFTNDSSYTSDIGLFGSTQGNIGHFIKQKNASSHFPAYSFKKNNNSNNKACTVKFQKEEWVIQEINKNIVPQFWHSHKISKIEK